MRPTSAIVRLNAIVENFKIVCRLAPGSKNVAVIKANAYGHGAVEVARALHDEVPAFAVAFFEEAVQLRDAGITKPILLLQGTLGVEDVAEAAARDFWLLLHNQQQIDQVLSAKSTRPVRVWLKVETGMYRLGMNLEEAQSACEALVSSNNIQPDLVLCTQLACADDLASPVTKQQVSKLSSFAAKHKLPLSIANSAAIMAWPESHADWNRPGYMLYGNSPFATAERNDEGLLPAMTLASEIIAVRNVAPGVGLGYGLDWVAQRQSRVGIIAIGYGDGYPRHAPYGTPVLVNGARVPLVGRVSMDMISVDLTDLHAAEIGDSVELWGQNLSVNEVASSAGTIGYELLAGLTARLPRVYPK
ncbi:MAG: alanine racemase [Proteobacteria bacterium]|nr:alanine racemase [Pseudomonadota bacterium]